MAGGVDHSKGRAAHVDRIAVMQKNVGGVPDPILSKEEGEAVLVGIGQHRSIPLVDVDLETWLGLAQGVHRHDVVEVAVGEQDAHGGTAVLAELAQNGGGGRGGVYDESLTAVLDEVAVGAVGTGEQVDDLQGADPPFVAGTHSPTLFILLL